MGSMCRVARRVTETKDYFGEDIALHVAGHGLACLRVWVCCVGFFFFITLGLELSDTKVYEP